jgi:hypothetical protein
MLEIMDCFFCNKYYKVGEFNKVIIKLPYSDDPKKKQIEVPVCKACFHILETGGTMDIQQSEDESLEDRVREIVHEEMETD